MSTLNKKMFRAYLVNLLDYMPEHLRKDIETSALLKAESEEHNRQEEILKEIIDQFFIETATWGLSLYERDYELTPNPGDDYKQRRNRIYLRLQRHQTSTKEFMKKLVKRYVSEDSVVDIEEYSANYAFKVIVDGGEILYKDDLKEAIDTYKPAHLGHIIEYIYKLLDELEIKEDDIWIIDLAKKTRERYPWRGRYFDTSWTFTPEALFDGAWIFNGTYTFDGTPLGEEDISRPPFCFNGDWAFDGNSRFEYQPSRKIIFRMDEPDELSVSPRTAIKEQYDVALPFKVLDPFGSGWAFGARDGPQETAFIASPHAVLPEAIHLQENAIAKTVLRAVLRDIYPLPHVRYFDDTWAFHGPEPFDGLWELGGNDSYRFGDIRYKPWEHLPIAYFEEQTENIGGTTYIEIPLCFDDTWTFGEAMRFGDVLEVPQGTAAEGNAYNGRTFDRTWKFFGLHSLEAFGDEGAQENLFLSETRYPESLQAEEEAVIQAETILTDTIVTQAQQAFDGGWEFSVLPIFGGGKNHFEGLPAFAEGQRFNGAWAFGFCSRVFNDSWLFGKNDLGFNADWHFHGERYFPETHFAEDANIGLRPVLRDGLEQYCYFGDSTLHFDGAWNIGGIEGPQEDLAILPLTASILEQENAEDSMEATAMLAFKESPLIHDNQLFNGDWIFRKQCSFDGAWVFGDDLHFGMTVEAQADFTRRNFTEETFFNGLWKFSPPKGGEAFRHQHEQEATEIRTTAHMADSFALAYSFRDENTFDGTWKFGEENSIGEAVAITVIAGLHFDEAWSFDDTRAIDGTWGFDTDSYCFGENSIYKNAFNGTWNFTAGTENIIRFERRWAAFGEYRLAV